MALKYKAGDRVRIKSLYWYNENKDADGVVHCGDRVFDDYMNVFCESVVTIDGVCPFGYAIREDRQCRTWTDEMIEGLVEEETKPKFKIGDRVITTKGCIGKFEGWVSDYQVRVLFEESGDNVVIHPKNLKLVEEIDLIPKFGEYSDNEPLDIPTMTTEFVKDHGLPCPDGYIFTDENGNVINATKIVLEKKKPKYPKTYEECCKVMGINHTNDLDICEHCDYKTEITYYEDNLLEKIEALYRLYICRDAYWKLYGEEMGLGKPWEPDWRKEGYIIYRNQDDIMGGYRPAGFVEHHIFEFPTKEMRDAFKENFDPDIEICKELL